MENRRFGLYFSSNDDIATIHIRIANDPEIAKIVVRSKNAEYNQDYEIELDSNDLELFGQMCIDLSEKMRRDHELRNACSECGGILAHHEYCSMFVRKN